MSAEPRLLRNEWAHPPGRPKGTSAGIAGPLVAVLTSHWESRTEEGWITRQIAGALACAAEVHVITPQGTTASEQPDSVFIVHQMATPVPRKDQLRRILLIESLSASTEPRKRTLTPDITSLLDRRLIDSWSGAPAILRRLRPDLVVIAGHQDVGAADAAERGAPDAPVTLIALGSNAATLSFSSFDRLFERSATILTVTAEERNDVVEYRGGAARVHRIGAPLAANPSALTEPNTWVGDSGYLLVTTGAPTHGSVPATDLGRLLCLRFPDLPVGISATDGFSVWHQGRLNKGWAVERSSDMSRLIAWARVTIDLDPGRLFGRRCIESLLYRTPIVVPHDSRAREHADLGRGGLWFATPGELVWCVEAILEADPHDAFGIQGHAYAQAHYGSTDAFIDRVLTATGISRSAESEIRAPASSPSVAPASSPA
jgi:hypothetical protein